VHLLDLLGELAEAREELGDVDLLPLGEAGDEGELEPEGVDVDPQEELLGLDPLGD
jgi:hypothetical protein